MKVSMNGLRKNLSANVSALSDIICEIKEYLGRDQFEEIADAMNNVIQDSNVLNCVFNYDDSDFSDLSDIEIPIIEIEE